MSPLPSRENDGGRATASGGVGSRPSSTTSFTTVFHHPQHAQPLASILTSADIPGPPPLRTSISLGAKGLLHRQALTTDIWRASITPAERAEVRRNIREAFLRNVNNFEEALNLVMALQEECLYYLSPSRLDYIKGAVQFDRRLIECKRTLAQQQEQWAQQQQQQEQQEEQQQKEKIEEKQDGKEKEIVGPGGRSESSRSLSISSLESSEEEERKDMMEEEGGGEEEKKKGGGKTKKARKL